MKKSTFKDDITDDKKYTFLSVSVAWDTDEDTANELPSRVFIKVPTHIFKGNEDLDLSGMIGDYFGYGIDDIYPREADERDRKRVKDWLLWTADEGLVEDDMRYVEDKGISKKLVKEGAGAGYTVRIKDLKFGDIKEKKLVKGKKRYDDYYVCQVEILPGEYEIEAEDYYNDFFGRLHEFGEIQTAKIDGGVATIEYSTNSYDEEESDDELRREISNMKLDISFDYGNGWIHADLPNDGQIVSDKVDVENSAFYGGIDKIELNAPDLADAVNAGHQSVYDQDEEDEKDVVTESYNDDWISVGVAFDEFRARLWRYTRKDRENRMKFFQDCMRKCEEAYEEYKAACVEED